MKKHKPQRFALSLFLLGVFWVLAASLFALEPESGEPRGNPFSLPDGVVSRSKLAKKDEKEKLVLQAITVANGEKRIASISGENVVVGDEIHGKKVLIIGIQYFFPKTRIEFIINDVFSINSSYSAHCSFSSSSRCVI